ncbi:MAG: ATP synthase F1 subunit delta [Candidatus Omnitrophica bacterium]|nr:ATP synthase F1 subunit delta [Candidatus Omnitrophota bacterium]
MDGPIIAQRYAQALFDAIKQDMWGQSVHDLEAMVVFLEEHSDINTLFISPIVPDTIKHKLLDEIITHASFMQEVENFYRVLLNNDRFVLIPRITITLKLIIQEAKRIVTARVRCPMKLTEKEKQCVIKRLSVLSGHTLDYEFEQDQSLLCGIVAHIGNAVYDFSLRNKLEKINKAIT